MKNNSPVIIFVLLLLLLGVSCAGEMRVSECRLQTLGKGLGVPGVAYQYYVEKNGGPKAGKVCDWTAFDIGSGFTVKNLLQGNYTFTVRGITAKGATVVRGSTTCYLSGGDRKNITIVLSDYVDESDKDTSLTLVLPISAGTDITAKAVYKNKKNKDVFGSTNFNKVGSELSAAIPLPPGYYDVSVSVYLEGVAVGGIFEVIYVPTGIQKTVNLSVSPRSFTNMYDIKSTANLNLKKGDEATLAWVGEVGTEGIGYWFIKDKIVENNSAFYRLPTSKAESYTVEYHLGSTVKTCNVTIADVKRVYENIMNFRSAEAYEPCIGYEYINQSGKRFPLTDVDVTDVAGFVRGDYSSLGLKSIKGTLADSEFAEISSINEIKYEEQYGKDISQPNTNLKKLIINGTLKSKIITGQFKALETILFANVSTIPGDVAKGTLSLKTVYIIPKSTLKISYGAFNGCSNLSKIYIKGSESLVTFEEDWNDGSNLTKADVVFVTDGELPW